MCLYIAFQPNPVEKKVTSMSTHFYGIMLFTRHQWFSACKTLQGGNNDYTIAIICAIPPNYILAPA